MKKWSSQRTQFMQFRKEAWKKFRTSTGFEPVTSQLPVRCSTNWAMKPLTLGAGQLWVHMFPWKKWVLIIYEIKHVWTAKMKWKWRNDRRSERNLCNYVKKPEKNSGPQRALNLWPRNTGAMLYQLSYEATDVGWKKWVLIIYEIKHIWTAEMKWKWRNNRCDGLPTELWSHWRCMFYFTYH